MNVKCNDEGCDLDGELTPEVAEIDMTIKGKLKSDEPCPSCGGIFESEEGEYVFIKGILQPVG
ncbi:hypothetical protein ACPV46_20035 [Photobacterium swingsii]